MINLFTFFFFLQAMILNTLYTSNDQSLRLLEKILFLLNTQRNPYMKILIVPQWLVNTYAQKFNSGKKILNITLYFECYTFFIIKQSLFKCD